MSQILSVNGSNPLVRLLYRCSRDGYSALDFHNACDGCKNTLVIVKDTEGDIFGAFAAGNFDWGGTKSTHSKDSFLFSLLSKGKLNVRRYTDTP